MVLAGDLVSTGTSLVTPVLTCQYVPAMSYDMEPKMLDLNLLHHLCQLFNSTTCLH